MEVSGGFLLGKEVQKQGKRKMVWFGDMDDIFQFVHQKISVCRWLPEAFKVKSVEKYIRIIFSGMNDELLFYY